MPYKLMITKEDGSYMTGQELFDYLTATGFTVPVKQPLELVPYPIKPEWPPLTATREEKWAYFQARLQYDADNYQTRAENAIRKIAYFKQFTDFTEVLAGMFVILTEVVAGQNPNGTKRREYQLVTPCKYSFKQCADRLMGAYGAAPVDPLHFICFDKF